MRKFEEEKEEEPHTLFSLRALRETGKSQTSIFKKRPADAGVTETVRLLSVFASLSYSAGEGGSSNNTAAEDPHEGERREKFMRVHSLKAGF